MAERAGKADRGALLAIVAEGFFSRLSFGLVTFALPLYAFEEFGLSLAPGRPARVVQHDRRDRAQAGRWATSRTASG